MYSVCILIYVSIYLYSYTSTHGISGLAAGGAWEEFEMRLKMTIEWTQRFTPRPWSSKFGDAHGGHDWVNLEAIIEPVWRCTWRPWSSEFRDMIHLEAVIDSVWRYTWRMWSSECGDGLWGRDRASLEMQFEAVIERDWTSTWRQSMDGAPGAETLFIS